MRRAVGRSASSRSGSREWQPTSLRRSGRASSSSVSVVAVLALLVRAARGRAAGRRCSGSACSSLIGAYAIRGVAWWPLAQSSPIAGDRWPPRAAIRRGRSRSARRMMRRLNIVVAVVRRRAGIALAAGLAAGRSGASARRSASSACAAGVTAALRGWRAPGGSRCSNPQPWGSWFEFALPDAARRHRFADRALPGCRLGRPTTASCRAASGWEAHLRAGASRSWSSRPTTRPSPTRLPAAGWRSAYRDADGSVFLGRYAAGGRYQAGRDHRARCHVHRAARVRAMTERTPDLDVVVLGGGGHVGLPAEPGVRRGRPARRHLRHQPGDPRPDRRRRDAVHGERRRRAAARGPRRRAGWRSAPTAR